MTEPPEHAVARHYAALDLTARIFKALEAAGLDPDRLRPEDLAPVDEFHTGGRPATIHAVAKMGLAKDQHVLDAGCGLGGAARYIASEIGCRATGVDLMLEYVAAARILTGKTGLASLVDYRQANALAMPFADKTFDAAISLHAAMNIKDRAGLYREIARVLKDGAVFCIYDVMRGKREGLQFPLPWATTPATSHLTTPEDMQALLSDSGFETEEIEDRTAFGIGFFRQRLAAAADGFPPLGLRLLMGGNTREKFQNLLTGLENGCVAPVVMIARRRG